MKLQESTLPTSSRASRVHVASAASQTSPPSRGHGSHLAPPTVGSHSSWAARLFGWIAPGGHVRGRGATTAKFPPQVVRSRLTTSDARSRPDTSPTMKSMAMTKRLIDEDRYTFVLLKKCRRSDQ